MMESNVMEEIVVMTVVASSLREPCAGKPFTFAIVLKLVVVFQVNVLLIFLLLQVNYVDLLRLNAIKTTIATDWEAVQTPGVQMDLLVRWMDALPPRIVVFASTSNAWDHVHRNQLFQTTIQMSPKIAAGMGFATTGKIASRVLKIVPQEQTIAVTQQDVVDSYAQDSPC